MLVTKLVLREDEYFYSLLTYHIGYMNLKLTQPLMRSESQEGGYRLLIQADGPGCTLGSYLDIPLVGRKPYDFISERNAKRKHHIWAAWRACLISSLGQIICLWSLRFSLNNRYNNGYWYSLVNRSGYCNKSQNNCGLKETGVYFSLMTQSEHLQCRAQRAAWQSEAILLLFCFASSTQISSQS